MYRRLDNLLALLVSLLAALLMAAWLIDQMALPDLSFNGIATVFNTALCFFISGAALLLNDHAKKYKLYEIGGAFLILFSGAIMVQDLAGLNFDIDHLFVTPKFSDLNPHPGRMAPQTAICFILCGIIFYLFDKQSRQADVAIQCISVGIMIFGIVGFAGAGLRLDLMYDWYQYSRMAIPTATGFILLAAALWMRWSYTQFAPIPHLKKEERKINVTGIVILTAISVSAGMSGFSILAAQMEKTLRASLQETYNNLETLVVNEVNMAVVSAQPVTTRLLINEYLPHYNANPDDAVAQNYIARDAQSFISPTVSGVAIYSAAGQIVALAGAFSKHGDLTIPLRNPAATAKTTLLWQNGARLQVSMDIVVSGHKIGTALVEVKLPYLTNLTTHVNALGATAETRICNALDDKTMQCLPSLFRPQVSRKDPRFFNGEPAAMDDALKGQSGTRVAHDYRHHQVETAYGPIGVYNLGMVVKIDTSEFYAPIRQRLEYTLLILLILCGIGIFIQRLQLAPLIRRIIGSEQEAKASNARIQAIMASVNDGIITVDEQGVIHSVNPAVAKIFGYQTDDLIGAPVALFFAAEKLAQNPDLPRAFLNDERIFKGKDSVELAVNHQDGHEFILLLSISAMLLEGKKYFVSSLRDITDRKRLEKLKNEFVSTVSHELRTPLTSIRGALGLVNAGVAGAISDKARNLVDIAYKNCERLIVLINDILDIEKIESGQMAFNLQVLPLKPLLQQAIELNHAYGEKFNVRFLLQEPVADVLVYVDNARLLQVLSNLLSNAAKFSPLGSTVEIAAAQNKNTVRIEIRDHGPGIPAEFASRIFTKFAQADSSDTKQKGGTGLGLNIARSMLERMGGEISYTTEMGVGTVFRVDLPVASTDTSVTAPTPAPDRHKKILICEDDPDIARILQETLQSFGIFSDIAHTAAQAQERLAHHSYEALTLDLALPDKNGIQLIGELRLQAATRNLPIIVVSAHAEEGRRQINGRALEVADWLTKPVDIPRLVSALNGVTRTGAGWDILHVEDDSDIAKIIALGLDGIARVMQARSLHEAENILRQRRFDLIILDMFLPDGIGIRLLENLDQNNMRSIPVIILSASDVAQDMAQKVSAALVKSKTSEADIIDLVKSLIGSKRSPHG